MSCDKMSSSSSWHLKKERFIFLGGIATAGTMENKGGELGGGGGGGRGWGVAAWCMKSERLEILLSRSADLEVCGCNEYSLPGSVEASSAAALYSAAAQRQVAPP